MLLYFVRHGDPIYEPDSLTPLGKRQAEAVGRMLSSNNFERIFASSSNRAILTATPLSEILHKEIEILDWCNEKYAFEEFSVDTGNDRFWCFETDKYIEMFASDEVRKAEMNWAELDIFKNTNFYKGIKRTEEYADRFFKELGLRHNKEKRCFEEIFENNNKYIIFAHGGFSYQFLSYVLDIPYPMLSRLSYGHTGVTVIDFRKFGKYIYPRLVTYSGVGHLYHEGLPVNSPFGDRIL